MGPVVTDGVETLSEVCAQCEEELVLMEDVIVIQVMQAEVVADNPHVGPILNEDNDFLYEHYFLHFKCWEEIEEEFKEEIENMSPVPDEFGILRCECCGSAIREGEPLATITMGELVRSNRFPSGGDPGIELVPAGAPDVYCNWCISSINENHLTFWEGGVDVDGECLECRHLRCWRGFDCQCTCHDQGEG